MKFLHSRMFTIFLVLAGLAALIFLFMHTAPFGQNPAATRLERIKKSPNYRDGAFQNLEPTSVMRENASFVDMMSDFIRKDPNNVPSRPLPSVQTNLRTLPDSLPTVVWFGHSSYLIRSNGYTILVDPVFSGYASPVPIFGKAYDGANTYSADDMPDIDLLLLTYDHYDHLDYQTITKLIPRVKTFCTSLGVGAHLERWGVSPDRIVEFDWYEKQTIAPAVDLTAVPARHFSGRGITRGKTLWSAFVMDLHGHRLFLGGDSGYGTHFKAIGEKYGPFDLALLECGQYGKDWPNIHMFPEEVAAVGQELRAKTVLPVHWAKFSLSNHAWNEPIRRFTKKADELGVDVTTPQIGEPVVVGQSYPKSVWWNF